MRTFFTVLLLAVIGSCSSPKEAGPVESKAPGPAERIVGKWQEIDGKQQDEYFKDGTALFNAGIPFHGKWQFLEDGRLKVDVGFLGNVAEVTFERDVMTMKHSNGVQKFRRVSEFAGPR